MHSLQHAILNELGVEPIIYPTEQIQTRTLFLQKYLQSSQLKGFVLGISGGQDSLLAGILAQNAVQQSRNEGYNASFHAVLMPYGEQADADDALKACDFIKPDFIHTWNIQSSTDGLVDEFSQATGEKLSDFNKGNIKARMRMSAQYALAGTYGLLVIGTDHAAEAITGFFTKFGDGGSDITPLSGLNKRQGKRLLLELGAPERFIKKPPTADLLDNRPGQRDEDELGISYSVIDDYLEGKSVSAIEAQAIEQRYLSTRHKRMPPVSIGPLRNLNGLSVD